MLQALTVLAATAAWASAAIPQAAWNQLQASIAGTVVLPSSALYANDTSQWNSRFRHYPAGVVFCNDTNDVAYALKFSQLYVLRCCASVHPSRVRRHRAVFPSDTGSPHLPAVFTCIRV